MKIRKILTAAVLLSFLCSCGTYSEREKNSRLYGRDPSQKNTAAVGGSAYSLLNIGQNSLNNGVNLKNRASVSGEFCYIEKTDTLFYSDGERLYQKNRRRTAVISERSASFIGMYDGILYFISGKGQSDGDAAGIYRLDPATGEETLMIGGNITSLTVTPDGLIYCVSEEETADGEIRRALRYFRCNTDGSGAAPADAVIFSDREYTMYVNADGEYVLSGSGGEKTVTRPVENIGVHHISRCGGCVYWIGENYGSGTNSIVRYDIDSGETSDRSFDGYIGDYAYVNGKIYVFAGDIYEIGSDGENVRRYISDGADTAAYGRVYSGGAIYAAADGDIFRFDCDKKTGTFRRVKVNREDLNEQ